MQDGNGFSNVFRFPNDFIVERNQRVRGEDDSSWMCASNRDRFADRIECSQLAQRKVDIEFFGDARRDARKFKTRVRQQLTAARRTGREQERRTHT